MDVHVHLRHFGSGDLSPLPKWISFSSVIIIYKGNIEYFLLSKYWINLVRPSLYRNCSHKEADKQFIICLAEQHFDYHVYFVFLNYLIFSLLKQCKEYFFFFCKKFFASSGNGLSLLRNMHN